MIEAMCRLPLRSAPGDVLRYSNAGYGVPARMAGTVSERPFWSLVRDRVFDLLGIVDIMEVPDGALLDRVVHVADTNHTGTAVETYNSAYWRGLALPWGGLFGTPRDAVRIAAAFLPSGPRLFSEPTTSLMINDQTLGAPGGVKSATVRWDPGFRWIGWETRDMKRRHWTGDLTSPRTFCHFGHSGTLLWGDPERDLAMAVFCNRMVTHM